MITIAEKGIATVDGEGADFSGIGARDLARLHALSFRLLRDSPLSELLQDVLDAAIALLDADKGSIQLYDAATGTLKIVAHRGFEQDFLDYFNRVSDGTDACGNALMQNERIVVEDVELNPIVANIRPIARKAGYRAVQSTPLRTSKRLLLGMLSTHFVAPRRPPAMQLRLLDLYAQQAERVIERKQAEEALCAKEHQLHLVTDSAPVVIAHVGRDLRYKFVNKACAERFGKKPEFFIGRSISEIFGEGVLNQARPYIERVLRGETFESEGEFNYPQIGKRVMRTTWTPDRDATGEVVGWVGVAADITERKRAENETKRFQFAVENSTEFIGMCDLEGHPFFVNAAALRLVGLDGLEALQKVEVKDFFFPEDQPFIFQEFLPRVLREGNGSVEIRFRHFKTGEALWMNYNVVTLREHGEPIGFATISQNITERKRAEALLRESEDRNRTLVESLPQLVWTCNAQGQCDYLSPQWAHYVGKPAPVGSTWTCYVHSDDLPRVEETWSRSVETGSDYRMEFRIRRADGVYRWFATVGVPLRNAAGEIIKWFGTNTDIHERCCAEEALRESQERLEAALSASRTGTFRWNIQTNGLDWDDELDRLFGLTPGDSARSLSQFIGRVHPDDRGPVIAACQRCAKEGADFHEEFRVIWPDGTIHWLEDKGRTVRDAGGQPAYMTGACIDITERKRVEAELRRSRETLRLAQEIADVGTFEWNIQSDFNHWSPELERIYGLKPGSFGGRYEDWCAMVHPDDLPAAEERASEALKSGTFSAEWRVRRQDGKTRWVEGRAFVFKDERGKPLRMVGVNFDVTRRKLAEQALHEAREKLAQHAETLEQIVADRTDSLKQAVAQMEEFSYSVSHDLRAPIRAMSGYAKLLMEEFGPVLGERGLHFAQRIARSSERMNQLTMDTLTLSKITRTPVALLPLSLDTLVADIISENPLLQPPHAEIEVVTPLGMVAGNASLLTQAISNLLVNAVKFVPAGRKPHVRVWSEPVDGAARLLIKDNGIGVAPEHQHRLFGIFQRVHPTAPYEGTGIGLAIVRKAVERLGGQAGMTSDGTSGSTFWIQLQLPRP